MYLPFWDSSCYPDWDSSCYLPTHTLIEPGSSLQPGNSRVEVTGKRLNHNLVIQAQTYFLSVLRAHKLPRLKTPFGKKRRFYVTVTDGTIAKKATAIRSVEQAVEWDEKLDALWDNCFLIPFCNWEPPVLHVHPPILYSVFMRSGNFTKISLLEHMRYLLNPNAVRLILETLLIRLAELPTCRRRCRPRQRRRQSKWASHTPLNDCLVGQTMFLNNHSRQHLHPDNDWQPTNWSYCTLHSPTLDGLPSRWKRCSSTTSGGLPGRDVAYQKGSPWCQRCYEDNESLWYMGQCC